MAKHGYVQLCMTMYGNAWLCRDIHISVWQCRPMYSCVGLCDQIHGSLVDILFYFTLFYFSSQICWNGNEGSGVVIFVSHTQTTCSYVIWAHFRA